MANENTNVILENLIDINLLGTYNNEIISFINGAIAAAKTAVKSEIINGAPDTFDTLKEVSDYISTHKDEYDALMSLVGGKVSSDDFNAAIERIVTLETKVTTLTGKVETLENNGVSVSLATDAQITAMFTSNS